MRATKLRIPDIILLEPKVFGDERGGFFESFNQQVFKEITGLAPKFVQDNHSRSNNAVLRGLHYQLPPKEQDKLIRVVYGEIFDVAVDVRRKSPTFGHWVCETLSAENRKELWIPAGFAHGFLTLSETAEVLYKTTDYYSPEHEQCIIWNDPSIRIDWPIKDDPVLAVKDQDGLSLYKAKTFL